MIIVMVIQSHCVLATARAAIFYKAFQQSESLRTQISGMGFRHHPSQGVLRSCCCSSDDMERNKERLSNYLSGNQKQSREKVRSHTFSGPAATRLLLFAHTPWRAQWPILESTYWKHCQPQGLVHPLASWLFRVLAIWSYVPCVTKRMSN